MRVILCYSARPLTEPCEEESIYMGTSFASVLIHNIEEASTQSRKWTWGKAMYLIVSFLDSVYCATETDSFKTRYSGALFNMYDPFHYAFCLSPS